MSTSSRRTPRAHIDPIGSAADAMRVFSLQIARPLSPETLVMFVDTSGCGFSLVSVSGTDDQLAIVDVAETMAMAAADTPHIGGLVIASVRPGAGLLLDDDEIWSEIDQIVDESGLILYDWLVIGVHGTLSVAVEFGMQTRWPRTGDTEVRRR